MVVRNIKTKDLDVEFKEQDGDIYSTNIANILLLEDDYEKVD